MIDMPFINNRVEAIVQRRNMLIYTLLDTLDTLPLHGFLS